MALLAALGVPGVLLCAVAGIELHALHLDRRILQGAADAAALNGAREMRVAANDAALERTRSSARANVDGLRGELEEPLVELIKQDSGASGIKVTLTSRRMSFFGNLLPPGGFVVRADSTALQVGRTPLCVLGVGGSDARSLDFPSATITAAACLVHSNEDLGLGGSTVVDAAALHAVGLISGGTAANSGAGAAPIEDPLTSLFAGVTPGACQHSSGAKVDKAGQVVEV